MEQLAPGLHRWTARHPAWEPARSPAARAALAPLLELDIGAVLVSHGDPVLGDGAAALRALLA